LVLPLAGCGESKEEKAKKQVCASRSIIETKVKNLQALPASVASLPAAKEDVTAIADELKKMTEAQKELSPSARKEFETATAEFGEKLQSIVSGLSSGSLANAEAQLKAGLQQLGTSFQQALAPLKCS
jgi:hypothetical protein